MKDVSIIPYFLIKEPEKIMFYKISPNNRDCYIGYIQECIKKGIYQVYLGGNPETKGHFQDQADGLWYANNRKTVYDAMKPGDICYCRVGDSVYKFVIDEKNVDYDCELMDNYRKPSFIARWKDFKPTYPQPSKSHTLRGRWLRVCKWSQLSEEATDRRHMGNLNTLHPLDQAIEEMM